MGAFTAGQGGTITDAEFFGAGYEDPSKSKVAGIRHGRWARSENHGGMGWWQLFAHREG